MPSFSISFADSNVTISCSDSRAMDFLSFLFGEMAGSNDGDVSSHTLSLRCQPDTSEYLLADSSHTIHRGNLDVAFAAQLYDVVIFHLLNEADSGVALHAGAVVYNDRVIILPGVSGAGKSSLTAWLTAKGCSYLSDELIFVSSGTPVHVSYFSRPFCLKPGSVPLIEQLAEVSAQHPMLRDSAGAVLPHRLLNPVFTPVSAPPTIILFPDYQAESSPRIEPISTARATTLLMGCHVNARNLEHHGFRQILKLASATSAYRLRYHTFQEAETCLADIIEW